MSTTDIPTKEPRSFIAGETLEWTKSFADFPASQWTLKYALHGPGTAPSDTTATANGDDFLVDIASSVSALTAGTWRLVGWVEKGSAKHYIYDDEVFVIAAPASGTLETRSTAKQIIDAIDTYMLTAPFASTGVKRYRIADRELERYTPAELQSLRTYYWNIYVREQRKGKMRNINCGF